EKCEIMMIGKIRKLQPATYGLLAYIFSVVAYYLLMLPFGFPYAIYTFALAVLVTAGLSVLVGYLFAVSYEAEPSVKVTPETVKKVKEEEMKEELPKAEFSGNSYKLRCPFCNETFVAKKPTIKFEMDGKIVGEFKCENCGKSFIAVPVSVSVRTGDDRPND
ncbi:MAG: hypothetical protein ACTSXC_07245, partial [Candidatus Freyarchaeota archaeon]